MAGAKMHSAKKKRLINNTIVHVILAILAFIWVFPIIWVILTSFRAEKGSYVSTFLPQSYTLDNYAKLFTDTSILNFPRMSARRIRFPSVSPSAFRIKYTAIMDMKPGNSPRIIAIFI